MDARLKANGPARVVKRIKEDLLVEYEKGIYNLTVHEEFRLLKKVEKLQVDKSQLELIAQRRNAKTQHKKDIFNSCDNPVNFAMIGDRMKLVFDTNYVRE